MREALTTVDPSTRALFIPLVKNQPKRSLNHRSKRSIASAIHIIDRPIVLAFGSITSECDGSLPGLPDHPCQTTACAMKKSMPWLSIRSCTNGSCACMARSINPIPTGALP